MSTPVLTIDVGHLVFVLTLSALMTFWVPFLPSFIASLFTLFISPSSL
jgi:hypothetical protein